MAAVGSYCGIDRGDARRAKKSESISEATPTPTCHHTGPSTHFVPWNHPWLWLRSQPITPATVNRSPIAAAENTHW